MLQSTNWLDFTLDMDDITYKCQLSDMESTEAIEPSRKKIRSGTESPCKKIEEPFYKQLHGDFAYMYMYVDPVVVVVLSSYFRQHLCLLLHLCMQLNTFQN